MYGLQSSVYEETSQLSLAVATFGVYDISLDMSEMRVSTVGPERLRGNIFKLCNYFLRGSFDL